jgi:hypothetical protein
MATTVLDSVTPITGARAAAARIEDLPAGLDWKAFSARCFPDCRRHDLEAVAAYFAYKELPREAGPERVRPGSPWKSGKTRADRRHRIALNYRFGSESLRETLIAPAIRRSDLILSGAP